MDNSSSLQNNPKTLALFSCASILLVLLSFGAGITGSYLGNGIFQNLGQPAGQSSTQDVTINEDSAVIDVVEQNEDAVVSIVITKELSDFQKRLQQSFGFDPDEVQKLGEGSGFIISSDGLIVTNRHVVSDLGADYTVVLNDGTELEAEVLARDTVLDIAVIKVNPSGEELSTVTLGSSDNLKVGQRVIAIGNSLGEFSGTVSYGIISGLSRSIIAGDQNGSFTERLEGVIQTDASINPGNSGGPLFDIQGNVVGVNVAVAQDAENIGFAIPIDVVKRIINDIEEFGEIRRPYLGVRFQSVNENVQETFDLTENYGALIIDGDSVDEPGVVAGGPADKAGLKTGDHILSINEEDIAEENPLQRVIQEMQVGDKVEIVYVRNGERQTASATLELANE